MDRSRKPQPTGFPAYDQKWENAGEPHIRVIKEDRPAALTAEDLTARVAQQFVNTLRKAEAKVTKITKEQQERAQQFSEYEKKLMDSYSAEKQRHQDHLDRLARELVEAKQLLADSKQAAARTISSVAGTGPQAMELQQGANTASEDWQKLLQRHAAPPEEPEVDQEALAFLRAYKAGWIPPLPGHAPDFGSSRGLEGTGVPPTQMGPPPQMPTPPPPSMTTAGTTGSQQEAGPVLTTYGAASPSSANLRPTPYPSTSPAPAKTAQTEADELQYARSPESRHASENAQMPTAMSTVPHDAVRTKVREGVKEFTKQPPATLPTQGPSLQQKLEQRRAAEQVGTAMRPFRQKPQEEGQSLGHLASGDSGQADSNGKPPTFVDDDPDQRAHSPGFAGME
ncbi:unnamed protein product [Symbiodinium sp. CCMP2592]|nr:unnamed protein product [Symbiodinium sp. CCMP2592]